MGKIKSFIKNNWSFILTIILVLVVRQTKIIGVNIVDGQSMDTTLHDGQIVLGSSIKTLERGDIVVAKTNVLVIKRVIGLPGDLVEQKNGKLYINGKEYEEPYLNPEKIKNTKNNKWTIQVGEDEYLIMGDNRDNSYDGRYYGPLPKERILEKIYIQLW